MADDIVTRLRYQRTNSVLCNEAADEIERLRKDRDRHELLAKYLCAHAPSIEIPEEIASLFPDPWVSTK